ncbi:ankyrin repeat domain-containing protein [Mycoavidus sp. B2-EB]|uniref:ankyrin repeat domain-containing protein n=1 Tax=Mycoavidus sp. B2-EB TaxID=2651972 RepID=UPI00162422B9|nr:ankyrin repeat domain-containing protein [Mycoavidus sp. B2-EB]BBO60276.1 hypothetical protein MPB2EB_1416 [Mycoavidus sp. B2-EB]
MLGNKITKPISSNSKRLAEENDQDSSPKRTKTSRRSQATEPASALINQNSSSKPAKTSLENLPTEVITPILLKTSPEGRAKFGQANRWAKKQFDEAQLALLRPYSDSPQINHLLFPKNDVKIIDRYPALKKLVQNMLTERPFSAEDSEQLHDLLCSKEGRKVFEEYPSLNDLIKNTILKWSFSKENGERIYSLLCSEEGKTALDKSPSLNTLIKNILSKDILSNAGSEHIHHFLSSPAGQEILIQEREKAFKQVGKNADLNEEENIALKQYSPLNELIKSVIAQQVSSNVISEKIYTFYFSEEGLNALAAHSLLDSLFSAILSKKALANKPIHEFLCSEEGAAAFTQCPPLRPLIEAILAQHIDQKHVNKAVTLLCSINPDHPVITRQHLVDFEWCKSDTGAEGGALSAQPLAPEQSSHVFKHLLLLLSQKPKFDGEKFLQISPESMRDGVLWTYDALLRSDPSRLFDFKAMLESRGFIHDDIYHSDEDEDEVSHPIIWASCIGHDPRFLHELLQEHFNPNAFNQEGESALHLAAEGNRVDSALLLLQYHAKLDARDNQGKTPLHSAAANSLNVTQVFINAGANINAKDHQGRTPLHAAISAEHMKLEVIQLLFATGADPTIKDAQGLTARDLAQQINRGEIFDSLLAANPPKRSPL